MNLTEAKQSNSKIYDGRPCRNCSSTQKYTVNQSCVRCNQERVSIRSKDIAKKYESSEKGREARKRWRNSDANKVIQNRYLTNSGNARERTARRRQIFLSGMSGMDEDEFLAVKDLYKQCSDLTNQTGIMHHVDHILPIADGGVHRLYNLQILTESDHKVKTLEENRIRNSKIENCMHK